MEADEMQEYYFYRNRSQIHGLAKLPVRLTPGDPPALATLSERRSRCVTSAVQDAQARFLALTKSDQQDIAEWKARIAMGARRDWGSCFDGASVRGVFYEPPDVCRVVMIFPCLPGEY